MLITYGKPMWTPRNGIHNTFFYLVVIFHWQGGWNRTTFLGLVAAALLLSYAPIKEEGRRAIRNFLRRPSVLITDRHCWPLLPLYQN